MSTSAPLRPRPPPDDDDDDDDGGGGEEEAAEDDEVRGMYMTCSKPSSSSLQSSANPPSIVPDSFKGASLVLFAVSDGPNMGTPTAPAVASHSPGPYSHGRSASPITKKCQPPF